VCDNSRYRGKSILVDFDYDKKTDIALPKLRIGVAKEQILTIDIDLKLASSRFNVRKSQSIKCSLIDVTFRSNTLSCYFLEYC
jgi:hypothetical protein